jgi:anti-sigma B factor antagonist
MTKLGHDSSGVDALGIRPPRAYAIDERPGLGDAVVLRLEGEFDLAAAPQVRERFEAVRDAGGRAVVVDLSDVEFVDSSMLRELLLADAALRESGGGLALAAVRPPVLRLLELTRTVDMLVVEPTVEDALARLRRPGGRL